MREHGGSVDSKLAMAGPKTCEGRHERRGQGAEPDIKLQLNFILWLETIKGFMWEQ